MQPYASVIHRCVEVVTPVYSSLGHSFPNVSKCILPPGCVQGRKSLGGFFSHELGGLGPCDLSGWFTFCGNYDNVVRSWVPILKFDFGHAISSLDSSYFILKMEEVVLIM